jgi:iron complex outermembrane receptor protein
MLVVCGVTLRSIPLFAQIPNPQQSSIDLKRLTIEELMAIDVTSVSRTAEPLGGAAAAVAVVTNEDIRRSGATTVPDALRLVPGIHVARQTSNTWAVSSRGFSSVNSEKLLVLTDTRSIYTPLFSGVFWDVQQYLLQDIDRIEVIRGPGATLWGSNAVNGVINISTKSARDTQGVYVETSTGTEERASVGARYGGRLGDRAHYRVFGRYFERDATFSLDQASADDWLAGHVGFRADWEANPKDTFTIQGDAYRADIGQLSPAVTITGRPGPEPPLRVRAGGGNLLARWRRTTSEAAGFQLRLYYDRTRRDDPTFIDTLHTLDADFVHRFPLARQDVTWGVNYRVTTNRNESGGVFALEPPESRDNVVGGFVQDQIRVLGSVRLTVGTKIEHNDFSGFELQPSGRLAWDMVPGHVVWGAVSRAVRVPTRLERDIAIDVSNPAGNPVVRLLGSGAFESERLLAYEAGYRWQTLPSLSIDAAAFHNRYRGLASLEFDDPFADPGTTRTVIPLRNRNLTAGRARGVEALVTYSPLARARLSSSYAHVDLSLDPGGQDVNRGAFLEGATPRHQAGMRLSLDLPARFQFDAQLRYLSAIRRIPLIVTGEGLPGYGEMDVRLAWGGWRQLEISVVGQNLLHARHAEFGSPTTRGEIERSVYGRIAWGF